MSPQGRVLTQDIVKELAAEDSLSLKFGQYLRKLLSGWAA